MAGISYSRTEYLGLYALRESIRAALNPAAAAAIVDDEIARALWDYAVSVWRPELTVATA